MTWRRSISRIWLPAIVALLTGCGGHVAPISTASAPSPISVPLPTTSTTLAAVTPVVPTTTIVVDPAVEEAVKQGVQDFFAAYMACGQDPVGCHPADFHSERGTAVGQGTVYFAALAKRGEYFGPDLRGSYIVTQSVALDDPTSAIAFSCWYDASVLLGPPDAPGGPPKVLNDALISVRQKQALYFDGSEWRVGEAATVEDLGDGNRCPPPDAP